MIKIIISVLLISISLLQDVNRIVQHVAYDSNVNLTISFTEYKNFKNKVRGIQFDLIYNDSHLLFNELTSLIDGAIFEYKSIAEGKLRCVIFNLDGKSFSNIDLSKLIVMSFDQKNNFYGNTYIQMDNIIVVGDFGEDISSSYQTPFFEIDFSELQPKSTYIHNLEKSSFQDSILVSFQTHEACNVNLAVYDIFDLKRKTLIDQYMDIGIYNSYLNNYDDLLEEFDLGQLKIKLFIDYSPHDSIYVVYDKNKN